MLFTSKLLCNASSRLSCGLSGSRCILALDRIKYVWNVGILVRNAAVLGFDAIYYVDGTADPFNWKVMVSAAKCSPGFVSRESHRVNCRSSHRRGKGCLGGRLANDHGQRQCKVYFPQLHLLCLWYLVALLLSDCSD